MRRMGKALGAGLLVSSLVLAGCGGAEDVVVGPDDDEEETTTTSPSSTTSSSGTTDTTEDEDEFSWNLPVGDTSISINEALLYIDLREKSCAEAQAFLDENWRSLLSPRSVLLYQAAVHFCAGRIRDGKGVFRQAEQRFGWNGVDQPVLDCNVYKAARSVVDQRPQESISCPAGEKPKWPGEPGGPRDDPRTPEDESQETTTSSSETTTSSDTTTSTSSTTTTEP
jgi:hypothetical protein